MLPYSGTYIYISHCSDWWNLLENSNGLDAGDVAITYRVNRFEKGEKKSATESVIASNSQLNSRKI